jgi:CRP-like cAMP-binding protein
MAGYDRALYQSLLHGIPMFSTCSVEQVDRLAQMGEVETFVDGQQVVREGDHGDRFYVVTSGHLRVDRGGHEVATLKSGDYFGELALLDPAPRNATVTAVGEPASLVMLTRDAFRSALDEMAGMRDAMLQGMARRIHELDRRI